MDYFIGAMITFSVLMFFLILLIRFNNRDEEENYNKLIGGKMFTISVKAAAKEKKVSRATIYNNKGHFDWEGTRIVKNKKYKEFNKSKAGRKRNV